MTDLSGRHALVTGAGSGVGAAIALALAQAGAQVTIVGRRVERLREAAAAHAHIMPAAADVTDEEGLAAAVRNAVERAGPLDIVVANAGAAKSAPFRKSHVSDFRAMLDVNLTGVFNTFHAGLDALRPGGEGRLIAIASTAGLKGYPYVSAYCAAKHGVIGLVRALALELARSRVTVNAICPGYTRTPMLDETIDNIVARTGRIRQEAEAVLMGHNPQNRFVLPEEVADAVLWLCGPGAASITGQAISVSGGET